MKNKYLYLSIIIIAIVNLIYFLNITKDALIGIYLLEICFTSLIIYCNVKEKKLNEKNIKNNINNSIILVLCTLLMEIVFYVLNYIIYPCNLTGFSCFLYGIEYLLIFLCVFIYSLYISISNIILKKISKSTISNKYKKILSSFITIMIVVLFIIVIRIFL